jgi:hypothetical protein
MEHDIQTLTVQKIQEIIKNCGISNLDHDPVSNAIAVIAKFGTYDDFRQDEDAVC